MQLAAVGGKGPAQENQKLRSTGDIGSNRLAVPLRQMTSMAIAQEPASQPRASSGIDTHTFAVVRTHADIPKKKNMECGFHIS